MHKLPKRHIPKDYWASKVQQLQRRHVFDVDDGDGIIHLYWLFGRTLLGILLFFVFQLFCWNLLSILLFFMFQLYRWYLSKCHWFDELQNMSSGKLHGGGRLYLRQLLGGICSEQFRVLGMRWVPGGDLSAGDW